ncbi:MAG TPA: hypothetical protein VEY07_09380 [Thermoplasmata archaeon]|nr:hypothetical protein [Thermoplasmata archaeon]
MARLSSRTADARARSSSRFLLAVSMTVGSTAAVAGYLLAGVTGTSFPGFTVLLARPQIAFSLLVGPTGLTFPCWAATRSRIVAAIGGKASTLQVGA